ncbi:PAS domain-containing protein, partial [Pseudoxanthomonas wuyuanensis]
MNRFSRLNLGTKLSLLVALSVALVLTALALLVQGQTSAAIETRAREDLKTATRIMQESIALYQRTLIESTERQAGSFSATLPAGDVVSDADRTVTVGGFETPLLSFGGKPINLDFGAVDRFTEATGSVATVFARTGEDFVRVSTSLTNEQGERVVGTALDHAHPAYPLMLQDQPYTGPARLFGRDYMTHYRPLKDVNGQTVGILFIGQNYSEGLAGLQQQLRDSVPGEHGYFFVVDMKEGKQRGSLVVHPHGEGQPAASLLAPADLAAFDALLAAGEGDALLSLASRPGQAPEAALLSATRFAPWQWALVAVEPHAAVTASTRTLVWHIRLLSVLALLSISALAWWGVRRLVAQPLQVAVSIANEVASGNLETRIGTGRQDEIGALMQAMRGMQANLRERSERDQAQAQENLRIRTALDEVTTNVMIADADRTIIYANRPLLNMLGEAEQDLRRELPGFSVASMLGSSIDGFHRHPERQARLLGELRGTHRAQIVVGGRTMQLIINPVIDADGQRVGFVVEWADRTAEVRVEEEITRIVQTASAGDLSGRIATAGKQGFLLALSEQLNGLLSTIAGSVDQVSGVLQALSQGDLTARMDGDFHGVFARMRDDANATVAQLTDIVG